MNKETFESAYVNGEFSPLEAMKSLDRENERLRRENERLRREAAEARKEFVRLENMSKRMVNELWDTIDALRKNMDIIEGR